MRLPDQTFDIGFEREAQGSEKLGHRRWADRAKLGGQRAQARPDVEFMPLRISTCVRLNEPE